MDNDNIKTERSSKPMFNQLVMLLLKICGALTYFIHALF